MPRDLVEPRDGRVLSIFINRSCSGSTNDVSDGTLVGANEHLYRQGDGFTLHTPHTCSTRGASDPPVHQPRTGDVYQPGKPWHPLEFARSPVGGQPRVAR